MTDPRIQERRVRVERQRGHRRLGVLLSLLAAAGLSVGAVAALHSRLFSARDVVVLGALHTPKSEVLQASGLSRRPPLLDVNPGAVSRRLDRLPWVLDASVHIEWPSTVAVALEERVPVAAARLEDGLYAIFDVSGRVLADSAKRPVGLPLVVVPGAGKAPGSFLGARARLVLSAAAGLPESLVARVEEISASSSDGVELKLNGGLRAVVGDDEALAEKYVSLATVLRRVDLTGVGAIDLRVAAAPVLTPLVTASNVHGKGDG